MPRNSNKPSERSCDAHPLPAASTIHGGKALSNYFCFDVSSVPRLTQDVGLLEEGKSKDERQDAKGMRRSSIRVCENWLWSGYLPHRV